MRQNDLSPGALAGVQRGSGVRLAAERPKVSRETACRQGKHAHLGRIATFPRKKGQELRLELERHERTDELHLRLGVWFPGRDGTMKPTADQVTIKLHEVPALEIALGSLKSRIVSEGGPK